MGLDNYACKLVGVPPEEFKQFAGDINLCGSIFSGHGVGGSFRGKVYADVVDKYFGLNLYDDVITPEQIRAALKRMDLLRMDEFRDECRDADDIVRYLSVCAKQNYYIVSWY